MKILSDRMLRIKGSAEHSRCTDLHALLNNFEHKVFCAYLESTTVQRCARKNTEFASGSKTVGENRREMANSLVTQDSTHSLEGSAEHSRCTCVDRPSRSHHEHFRTQGSAHRAY